MSISTKSFLALLSVVLCASQVGADALAQTRPLTAAEQAAAGQDAAAFARDEHAKQAAQDPEFVEGGENGAGKVRVGQQLLDVNKINPGADQAKAAGLEDLSEKGQNFDALKARTSEEETRLSTDRGAQGNAARTFEQSSYRAKQADVELRNDNVFWQRTLPAIAEGRSGNVNGQSGPNCTTTTRVETQPSTGFIEDEYTCERVPDASGSTLCTREYEQQTGTVVYDQDKRALLGVSSGTSGQICQRTREVTSHQETLSQSRQGQLEITDELAGLSCRRYRWAEQTITSGTAGKDATLPVNDEMGGLSCSRERWVESSAQNITGSRRATIGIDTQTGGLSCTRYIQVTDTGGVQAGSMTATLNVNNESGGLACQRWRTVTGGAIQTVSGTYLTSFSARYTGVAVDWTEDLSSVIPAGSVVTDAFAYVYDNPDYSTQWPSECNSASIVVPPSAANGYVATLRGYASNTSNPYNGACERGGNGAEVMIEWTAEKSAPLVWGVAESGNCADTGTANCPTSWACNVNAPTTINGVNVTATQVSALPALFGGAPSSCTAGSLTRTCSGNADTTNQVNISSQLPAGTTSISGFGFSVINPQVGVSVSLTQTPSVGNGWVAIFRVTRSSWAGTPSNPKVQLFWNSNYGTVSHSLVETGNCGDPGSTNCPTQWSCTANAPTTINGGTVSTEIAAARAPLFPGAATTCASAALNRVCSGVAAVSSNVSIADLIPGGTTAIQNFAFSVVNPQTGVTVTLVSAPTLANSWVATFRVEKVAYGAAVVNPTVDLSWVITGTTYNWSIRETGGTIVSNWGSSDFWARATASIGASSGEAAATATATNCSDPGSAACPTQWSCRSSAPTTINGIAVSEGMVSSLGALFPGAAAACVAGDLNRVCSGASTVGTTVPIGDVVPAGVTEIRNLSFQVLNPQPGVAVQMVVPPTYANGWSAGFEVTRTDYATRPDPVQVRIMFEYDSIGVALSLREEGNCSDPGSTACPTQWSCADSAPTTINGQSITLAMVQAEPILYPGATSACVAAELKRICNGTSATSSQIPIGDLLPAGTTEITNFQWSVQNPQAALSITLVSAPSMANGWVATFNVDRNYAVAGTPAKPSVMLTWNVLGPIQYDHTIVTEGDCSGAADGSVSPSCPVRWTCLEPLPASRGGITITPDMLNGRPELELFPGEGWTCGRAVRERVCSGAGSATTVVDISSQIPAGLTSIRNYNWVVSVPAAGVGVTQLSPPTVANGWKATFQTTRTDWAIEAVQPEVHLTWQIEVASTGNVLVETGDCAAEGDEFCQAKWRCVEEFPPSSGTALGSGTMDYEFLTPPPGQPHTFNVYIGGALAAGTDYIQGFQMQVLHASVKSQITGVVQTPSAANGWIAVIQDDGVCDAPLLCGDSANPNLVQLTWEAMDGTSTTPPLEPLYPGAPAMCRRAERYLDCSGINDGEVCHETEQGTVCEVVVGGPVDTCSEYRTDPTCRLDHSVCNEDGWGGTAENPVCRIWTDVYMCRREVQGDDVIVRDTTTCTGEMSACLDGSCTSNVVDEDVTDSKAMRKASAQLALREAMQTDYVRLGAPPPGGGGSNPDPGTDPPKEQTSIPGFGTWAKDRALAAAELIVDGVVTSAQAQTFDPFKMPSGYSPTTGSDPDAYTGAFGNYTAQTMRFFDGKSYNCMKALGGLLNCCTKKVDPNKTGKEWWSGFGDILHRQWSENRQCTLNAMSPSTKASGSGELTSGATPDSLSQSFTGLQDRLTGGGSTPSCNNNQPRMEDVMRSFMGTMRSKYFPKLAWYCDSDEKELAALKETGNCSYLGDYCAERVLGFCVDKRQRHCCFNSPMTKMIREQLKRLGIRGMGTAKHPDCSGVSPAEFARMNTGDMDTNDLEGRMLQGGMFPDMSAVLAGNVDLLELFTGTGSSINTGRVNTLDRTNTQLSGTDPNGALTSIEGILNGQVTTPSTPSGTTAGHVSFATGFRSVRHGSADEKQVAIQLIRDGRGVSVSATVEAQSGTALQGTDFTYSTQTVSWGGSDTSPKDVIVTIRKTGKTDPVSFELKISSVGGGAEISPTGSMEVEIEP